MKAAYNAVYVEARYHGRASVKTENSTAEPIMKSKYRLWLNTARL